MAIKQAITDYLDAVERRHGAAIRAQTSVEYREGSTLVIKRGKKPAQLIDMEMLRNLTSSLRAYA